MVVALASIMLTMALPTAALAKGVTPAVNHIQQNWSKQHSPTPAPLANCAIPVSASGDDCYNPGTQLTWTLTLDVCSTSTTTCDGGSQLPIVMEYVVALLPPGETYVPGSQTSATLNTSYTPTFSTGLCSDLGAPPECTALTVPSDTFLLWNFTTNPTLDGHPQAQFTYAADLNASDNTTLTDWAVAHYTRSTLEQNPVVSDEVFVANPILDIAKSCPSEVLNNSAVQYNVTLSNLGHQNATGVTMTDPAPTGVTFTSASATSPTASYTPSQGQWTGTLAANSSVNVTFGANINTSAASVLNVANYTSAPAAATFIHHNASCLTLVDHPEISVVKTVDPTLVSNQTSNTINITANVTNTGDTTLYNISVNDSLGGLLSCPSTTLAPGASMNCTGSYVIPVGVSADYSNDTVVANGTDRNHEGVNASDNASVQIVHPSISVEKVVDPTAVSNVTANTINISANVTNTGDTTLYNVSAIDSLGGTLTCPSGTLAAGAWMICTGSYDIPQGTNETYSNDTVVANGSDFAHNNVTDTDNASVVIVHPAIMVVKAVDPTSVSSTVNNTINVTANVTNVGDVTLYNVTVNDSIAGALTCPQSNLTPGEWMICTGSYQIPAGTTANSSTDTVTASGCDTFGDCVNDTDNKTVLITHPSEGGVTDTQFCPLPNDTFRLIYNKFGGAGYQLKSSNPGQFYYNVFSTAGMANNTTLTVTIPYPFVTMGHNPIQVFLNQPLPTCPSSPPSTNINSQFAISPTTFGLSAYSPQDLGSTVTVNLTLTGGPIAPGNQIWVAIHLAYGLKGQLFNMLSAGSGSCPAPPNVGPCAQLGSDHSVVIDNLQDYTFSNSYSGATTVYSWNDFNVHGSPAAAATQTASVVASGAAGGGLALGLLFGVAGLVWMRRKARPGEGADDPSMED